MFTPDLIADAATLLDSFRQRGLRIAAAESCTGGLVTALLTEIAGSSDVVERGFVTYSNAAKHELLGVPETMLARLSEREREVAVAIARGRSNAEISADLFMSVATVKAHVSSILTKLDLNNRTQIALLAHDAGLIR